jgi:peptidoglycan/xylan/chitin deacetylase (PgdA/CDA1 family)
VPLANTPRRFAAQVIKSCAYAIDLLRRPENGLVVLIYHRVGRRTPIEVDLPSSLFADHMSYLAGTATVVSLTDGLRRLHGDGPPSEPLVAITFDDGTADFADVALPILVRHRLPVTLYLATAFVEEQRPFPDDGAPLSWSALRDAAETGLVDIGSHTHTHALLDRLPADQVAAELDRSIGLIGDRLGLGARHFAYPKALAGSDAAANAVRSRFASAAVAGTRPNLYERTDPYRLARSPVQLGDGMRWFRAKARGGLRAEDELRGLVNHRRYAGATT